jgi:hypothetical protein
LGIVPQPVDLLESISLLSPIAPSHSPDAQLVFFLRHCNEAVLCRRCAVFLLGCSKKQRRRVETVRLKAAKAALGALL